VREERVKRETGVVRKGGMGEEKEGDGPPDT
jgi:hypothetical protein